jgi:hypothetical protein
MVHVNNISGSKGSNYVPAENERFNPTVGEVRDFYLECDPRIQTCPDPQMTALISLGSAALFGGLYDASVNDYQLARQKFAEAKRLEQRINDIIAESKGSALPVEKAEEAKRLGKEMLRLFDEVSLTSDLLHSVSGGAVIPRVELLLLGSEALLSTARNDLFLGENNIHPDGYDRDLASLASSRGIGMARSGSEMAESLLRKQLQSEVAPLERFALQRLLVKATRMRLEALERITTRESESEETLRKVESALKNVEGEIPVVLEDRPDTDTNPTETAIAIAEARTALQQATEDSKITEELRVEVACMFVTNSFLNPAQKPAILYTIYQLGLAESEEEALTRLSSGDAGFKNSLAEFGVIEPTYLLLADKARQIQTAKGEFLLAEGFALLTSGKASEAVQKLAETRDFLRRNGIIDPSFLRAAANHAVALVAHADSLSKERKSGTGVGQIAAAYETAMETIGELARTNSAGVLSATYIDTQGNEQRLMRLYAKAATGNRALAPDRSAVSAAPILGMQDALIFELRHVSEKELATNEGKAWLRRCLMSLGADMEKFPHESQLLYSLKEGELDSTLKRYLADANVEAIKTTAEEAWLGTAFSSGRRGPRSDKLEKGKGGHETPFKK